MDKNSNIVKFSKLFDLNYSLFYENQTYERLFGIRNVPVLKSQIKTLPENTSLQKNAKRYKLSNGRFGLGIGTIKNRRYSACNLQNYQLF